MSLGNLITDTNIFVLFVLVVTYAIMTRSGMRLSKKQVVTLAFLSILYAFQMMIEDTYFQEPSWNSAMIYGLVMVLLTFVVVRVALGKEDLI